MSRKKTAIAVSVSLTTLSALVIGTLIAVNKGIEKLATSKNLLDGKNREVYHWRFGDVSYRVVGEGRPLLLIHDLEPGSSSIEWNELIPRLAKNHTVYALDLIGCGLSEHPAITYTNYLYIQLIHDFVENVIKRQTNVIVTGKSASFLLDACSISEEFYRNIVLINPDSIKNSRKTPSKRTKTAVFLLRARVIGTPIYNILTTRKAFTEKFENRYFYDKEKIPQAIIDCYYESAHLGGSFAKTLHISQVGRYTSDNIIRALKDIDKNIHILASAELPDIEQTMKEYQYYNPAVEIEYLDYVKELPQLEAPDTLMKYLEIYL